MENIIKQPVPNKIYESEVYNMIKRTKKICVVNGQFFIEDSYGIWRLVTDREAMICVRKMFAEDEWQAYLTHGLVGRIAKSLRTDPDLQASISDFRHEEMVLFENGVWNLKSMELDEEGVTKNKFCRVVDAVITKDTPNTSPIFDMFCKKVFKSDLCEQKKQVLYEIIGFCISDIENVKKAIVLIGPSNCGKSVILRLIQRLVGEADVSNVSLSSFSEKFSTVEMYGKILNISGEIPSAALPGRALDVLKSITGGDRMELEKKGSQPFSATVDTKLLFAGNTLPTFAKIDGSNSLVERLHLLIFDNEVMEAERDIELEQKLWDERDAIVKQSLVAVAKFLRRKKVFLTMADENRLLENMKHVANPVAHFIEECIEFGENYAVHITDVYEAYIKFATAESLPNMERVAFRNMMSMQNGVVIGKKKQRLGKPSPMVCFEGIQLKKVKEKVSYKGQDTEKYDEKEEESWQMELEVK